MRRSRKSVLFIDRADQNHRRTASRLFLGQSRDGRNHRRHAAFDVARATTKQLRPLDLRYEWLNRHSLDRHRVLVGFEHDDLAAALGWNIALDPRDDVVAQGRDRVPLHGQSQAAEKPL